MTLKKAKKGKYFTQRLKRPIFILHVTAQKAKKFV